MLDYTLWLWNCKNHPSGASPAALHSLKRVILTFWRQIGPGWTALKQGDTVVSCRNSNMFGYIINFHLWLLYCQNRPSGTSSAAKYSLVRTFLTAWRQIEAGGSHLFCANGAICTIFYPHQINCFTVLIILLIIVSWSLFAIAISKH